MPDSWPVVSTHFPSWGTLIVNGAQSLHSNRGEFDYDRLEAEVVASAMQLVTRCPDVGAILLECSDLPPFAAAIQRAVRLPVFDFITMINWVYQAVAQQEYEGLC